MKILITGDVGFIGKHLVEKLISLGHEIIGVDLIPMDVRAFNYGRIVGNARCLPLAVIEHDNFDAVIHLAAFKNIMHSIEHPLCFFENNICSTTHMLDICRQKKVKKFIFASSSSVYGDDSNILKIEGETGFPLNPYAASKKACEDIVNQYSTHYGINGINLRFFNVYGKGNNGNVFDHFSKAEDEIKVYGDCERDFTRVSDIVSGIVCALNYDKAGTFNLGTGKSKKVLDIAKLFGKKIICKPARIGEIENSCADISLAKRELGYEPEYLDINTEGVL